MQEYIKQHGNADVPQDHPILGNWVGTQRSDKRKNKLTEERIKMLDSLGFTWNTNDHTWDKKFSQLKIFYNKNNNTNVHRDDTVLGKWASTQRIEYSKDMLSIDRIKKLDSVDFIWDINEYLW